MNFRIEEAVIIAFALIYLFATCGLTGYALLKSDFLKQYMDGEET